MHPEKTGSSPKNAPLAFVIFGATGDLAKKRIFPSLFNLYRSKLLPDKFKIVAAARTPYSNADFRKLVSQMINVEDKTGWQDFAEKIDFLSLDVAENINLGDLAQKLDDVEKELSTCVTRVFYMSIAPDIFEKAVENLGANNLNKGCPKHSNSVKSRIIVEKPFGQDLASAKSLAQKLYKYFKEEQIYRIDHYLGKETVQNIFSLRFANEIVEPLWNNKFIDHVQITTAEEIGVLKRGEFYDKTGALRDIVQNHLMQLLALITMDPPKEFTAENIGQEKFKLIKNVKRLSEKDIASSTVRGQYEGYLEEEKINPKSKTETYALVKLFVENERWRGIPFYLRTGKKLTGKATSIIIQFKEKGHSLFGTFAGNPVANVVTIQIQPNEGIGVRLAAKKPGLENILEPIDLEFCYKTSLKGQQPDAYQRLIMDVISGDQSLFISQDFIEEAWKIFDPIALAWQQNKVPLERYKQGSWGPEGADKLIEKAGKTWLMPILSVCNF